MLSVPPKNDRALNVLRCLENSSLYVELLYYTFVLYSFVSHVGKLMGGIEKGTI